MPKIVVLIKFFSHSLRRVKLVNLAALVILASTLSSQTTCSDPRLQNPGYSTVLTDGKVVVNSGAITCFCGTTVVTCGQACTAQQLNGVSVPMLDHVLNQVIDGAEAVNNANEIINQIGELSGKPIQWQNSGPPPGGESSGNSSGAGGGGPSSQALTVSNPATSSLSSSASGEEGESSPESPGVVIKKFPQ